MITARNTISKSSAQGDGRSAWRRFAAGLALVQLVNLACAVAVTGLSLTRGPFAVNLLFSICIGTIAYLIIAGGRLLIWPEGRKPGVLPLAALILAGLPVAQIAGSWIAGWLLEGIIDAAAPVSAGAGTPRILVFTLIAGLIACWFFWNRSRLATLSAAAESEKARAAAIEKQAAQAQLQLLQAQIEPHMLFNTLANLQGLIAADPARAQALLDQLIQYLRSTLSSSRNGSTTLAQEFDLMRAYLGLMSVRMGTRLHYTLDLPAQLEATRIAPMLLQPLVENALRHGLEPLVEGGTVAVSARASDGMLIIEVSDDGAGLDAAGTAGTGLGLDNIRERIAALYGPDARLRLAPRLPSGTIATLTLPRT
ncbi:sensor histidine kinase [Lacisediminimonas profundi]|uniref:sensor histidine kinase n=1 Tax=Lacisediminimonas profundi TaxID=2603856 RepID=UPI00138746DC|nr:histidine kinase [Lacisediminimonas profundi]